MQRQLSVTFAMLFGLAIAWQTAAADGLLKRHHAKPACEPGYQIVEETVFQDVKRTVCKMVPQTKKKWVYSWIDDPFCIQNTKHGQGPHCCGPYGRKQLVKMQIDEPCPTMQCVTETICERVPITVYRKVPIGTHGGKAEPILVAPKPVSK